MVKVSAKVAEGLEAVRASGRTNMLDRPQVVVLLGEMVLFGADYADYIEALDWVLNNPREYSRLIFEGYHVVL